MGLWREEPHGIMGIRKQYREPEKYRSMRCREGKTLVSVIGEEWEGGHVLHGRKGQFGNIEDGRCGEWNMESEMGQQQYMLKARSRVWSFRVHVHATIFALS